MIPHVRDGIPPSGAFGLKPVSLLGLLPITTFIADSRLFTLPTI